MTKPEEGRQWVREMKTKGMLGLKCFGYRPDAKPSAAARWPERLTEWLEDSGLLKR